MTIEDEMYDITLIGGGPVGLFTAFYAGLRQAKVKIIESLETLGGQPTHLYAEKNIYDIPAYPSITGAALGRNLQQQLNRFDTTFCLGEEALAIEQQRDNHKKTYYRIETSKGVHFTRTIIIAAGNGAFTPRKLKLEQAEKYEKSNLHYYVQDLNYFTGKTIAICGGGDSAVDWALTLESYAKKIYLIHRRNKFRAVESSVNELLDSSIEILTPYIPIEISGDESHLSSILLQKARDEEKLQLAIDELIVSYGFSSSIGPIRKWGFSIKRNAIEVNSQLETSLPGIFAIGDIAHYEGKVKIIATGFGEAPLAVNNALLHIDPTNIISPVHSTDLIKER